MFEAIYARGGVSAAARHLNLSQSAVSHALGRLRLAFEDELFVRFGNALVPTPLARAIAEPVRDALHGVEQALVAAAQFDPATATRGFRIGLRPANEARVFADIVALAAQQAPGVTLASVNFRRSDLARDLATGDLDMAIDVPSDAVAGLRAIPLQNDSLVVAVRRDHPAIGGAIDLDTYLAAGHVQASPRPTGPGLEDEALTAIGKSRHVAVRCQNIWSAWQIVSQTDLIFTLLDTHARAMLPIADNRLLPLPFPIASRPLQLLWHQTTERDPGNRWLRQLVARQLGQSDVEGHAGDACV